MKVSDLPRQVLNIVLPGQPVPKKSESFRHSLRQYRKVCHSGSASNLEEDGFMSVSMLAVSFEAHCPSSLVSTLSCFGGAVSWDQKI